MIRYTARVEGDPAARKIDIHEAEDGHYRLSLDGVERRVDAVQLCRGAVSLIVDGQVYSVEFEKDGDAIGVHVRDQVFRVDVADERRLRMRGASSRFALEGNQTVSAPMPGRVVKVLVAEGSEVAEGQALVVVEAMKMENELKSPKTGRVVEVRAREGEAVEAGAALVVVG